MAARTSPLRPAASTTAIPSANIASASGHGLSRSNRRSILARSLMRPKARSSSRKPRKIELFPEPGRRRRGGLARWVGVQERRARTRDQL
jgi:hypothetical protein